MTRSVSRATRTFSTRSLAAIGMSVFLQGAEQPGALLRKGMHLVYSSDGTEQRWTIEALRKEKMPPARACIRIHIRYSPTQAIPDTRVFCRDERLLYTWNDSLRSDRPSRPLVREQTLEVALPNGGKVNYAVGNPSVDTVSGIVLKVLPTTVVTHDLAGRPVRRLHERFSIGLATATRGVFEVADSTQASGWRTAREFKLVRIE